MMQTALSPRVIVVEDERIVALHLQQLLAKLGFQVIATASSGEQALSQVMALSPDIVLMDIHLDGAMDGIETAGRIPSHTRASVIYLTANSEPATIERARATKPHGYLIKPLSERSLFITITMVMERRRAEFALQESEERLRLALDAAELGSWELDLTSRTMEQSASADALFGVIAPSDGTWDGFLDRIHADDRARLAAAFGGDGGDDKMHEAEVRRLAPDGTSRWLRIQGKVFPAVDGSRRIIGVVQDVSERRQHEMELARRTLDLEAEVEQRIATERALRKSEEAFRQIFISNPLPMWAFSQSSLRFLAVNDAAIEVYGYTRDEFQAMTLADLVPPDEADRLREAIRALPATYQHLANWTHRRKSGEIGQADLFTCASTFEGMPVHLCVAVDVTRRNVIEQQLRQGQKMEALGQLTGGIAHDFNNLLAVISGNLELLTEGEDDPERHEMLTDALHAAERGAALTDRLLSFSRQQHLAPEIVDVGKLVAGLSSVLGRLLEASIRIRTVLPPGLWRTRIDPAQLENAVINLAVNARDAMPGGGTLTIQAENVTVGVDEVPVEGDWAPGSYVMLAISDTGTGIPHEVLDRVIDPFFTTKPVGKGTGLGLSMVYGFVRQSGGHMRIESEPGSGTTVRLYLPRTAVTKDLADPARTPDADPRARPGEVVLVVEDDPSVRKLAVRILVGLGYLTLDAGNGKSGLQALDTAHRVDLLLSDMMLPDGMDGRMIAQEARRRRPELKVLFMSGYAPDGLTAPESGEIRSNLSKPFTKSELARAVRNSIDA